MLFGYSAMPADCEAARKTGYDYVELPAKVIAAMTDKEFSTFAGSLQIQALRMNAFCPPDVVIAGTGHDISSIREYTKRLAPRAAALGVKMVGIGSPMSRNIPKGFCNELAQEQIETSLCEISYILENQGIAVCLEALATCYCNTVNTLAEAVGIVRKLQQPNIHVVLDFYNMEHMGEADISLLELPFAHVHISDDDGAPNLRSYLKPEKKEIHQKRLRKLPEKGYDGCITLEVDVPYDPVRAAESLRIMIDSLP